MKTTLSIGKCRNSDKPVGPFGCRRCTRACWGLVQRLAAGMVMVLVLVVQAFGANVRWASTSNRIYVENGGPVTLSEIKAAAPKAPLDLVDPKNMVWLLRANVWITDGSTLVIHGTAIGGDANEVRLQSLNSNVAGSIVSITADWGSIDIHSTKITSWDSVAGGPDTEFLTYGRAFVRVRSSLAADGVTPLESRMDITASDIGHLGYEAAESYGLSWKVTGIHPDPAKSIFDFVEVYGDVTDSHIHDNYFGIYTFGAYGSRWLNNEVDHNAGYGIDPHDDSDYLDIEGNNVHHNGVGNLRNKEGNPRGLHGIIASRRCDHLVLRNNRSWANAGNGIMLHRHCDDSIIENNETSLNGDSGIALFDVDRTFVRNNLILSNSNAGLRLSQGTADSLIESNHIAYSGTNGFYFYAGTNAPEPDPVDPVLTNRGRRNQIVNNVVQNCGGEGLKLTDGDENVVIGNRFMDNGPVLLFRTATLTQFVSNSIPTNVTVKLEGSPSVLTSLHVSSQPLLNVWMDTLCSGCYFEDPDFAIFDIAQSVYTAVSGRSTGAGSSLTLNWDEIGGFTTVVTRDFRVFTQSGMVWVNPTLWNQSGDRSKAWSAHADTDSPIDYIVGDLLPGTEYEVRQNSKRIGTFTADSSGRIEFTPPARSHNGHTNSSDQTTDVKYLVSPH
jgi:mannuronan 5-epimerase